MHRIDGAGHVNNRFVNEDPATNRPPTEVTAEWLNANQEELVAVIAAAQIVLDKANNGQLLQALRSAGVFQTPPQFDTSTKAATMEALQRALGNLQGARVLGANTALSAADAGKYIYSNVSSLTHTLPDTATLRDGVAICAATAAGFSPITFSAVPGQMICNMQEGGTVQTLVLDGQSFVIFIMIQGIWHAMKLNSSLGINQTWQNVTASRAIGTTYTNTTGRPIVVAVLATIAFSGNTLQALVNGVISGNSSASPAACNSSLSVIVPPGATYVINGTGTSGVVWSELR